MNDLAISANRDDDEIDGLTAARAHLPEILADRRRAAKRGDGRGDGQRLTP